MPSPIEVIDKLQQMLIIRNEMEDKDDYVDVPYVDDDEYATHRPYGEQAEIQEQKKDEEDEEDIEAPAPIEDEEPAPEPLDTGPDVAPGEEEAPAPEEAGAEEAPAPPPEEGGVDTAGAAEVGAEAGAEAGAETGAEAGADVAGAEGEMGGDEFGAGGDEFGADAGMPGAPEPLTPKQIGKIYELKKIYTRLSSLESFLADTPDKEMVELRNKISDAIDLFKTLSANFQQYKDQLDDIIVNYYKFLKASYGALRKYYKANRGKDL